MGDIYSPFIRLEQAKCYNLELTAGVCVCGSVCAGVCPHFLLNRNVYRLKEVLCHHKKNLKQSDSGYKYYKL